MKKRIESLDEFINEKKEDHKLIDSYKLLDAIESKFGDYAWDLEEENIHVLLGEDENDPTIEISFCEDTNMWDVFIAKTNYIKPTKIIASGLTKIGEITRAVKKALKDPIIKKFEEDQGW